MTDRREPTISSSPLPLDKEEKSRVKAQGAPTDHAQRQSSRPTPPPVSGRTVVVRSPLGLLAFLLALAGLGLAGYVYYEAQQRQESILGQLSGAEARIAELEGRLMAADDESSQSITSLQVKISENSSEIRKLWGIAYDRNRKAIADLETAVQGLQKSVAGVDSQIKTALAEVNGEVRVIADLLDAQQSLAARTEKAYESQAQSIESLLERLPDLQKRVSGNEEAIKAIDAFRLQVNRELLQRQE